VQSSPWPWRLFSCRRCGVVGMGKGGESALLCLNSTVVRLRQPPWLGVQWVTPLTCLRCKLAVRCNSWSFFQTAQIMIGQPHTLDLHQPWVLLIPPNRHSGTVCTSHMGRTLLGTLKRCRILLASTFLQATASSVPFCNTEICSWSYEAASCWIVLVVLRRGHCYSLTSPTQCL